jgi:hypothetical protein
MDDVVAGAPGAWIAGILLTILLAALSTRTFLRNAEYQDPELIWTDNVIQRPANPRAHFNLGFTHMAMGRPEPRRRASSARRWISRRTITRRQARWAGRWLAGKFSGSRKFYTDEMSILPAFLPEAHLQRGRCGRPGVISRGRER